jgi:hypothetical protein
MPTLAIPAAIPSEAPPEGMNVTSASRIAPRMIHFDSVPASSARSLAIPSRIEPRGMNMLALVIATTDGIDSADRYFSPALIFRLASSRSPSLGRSLARTACISVSTGSVSSVPRSTSSTAPPWR